MMWKDDYGRMGRTMAVLSIAAGVLRMLQAGPTEASEQINPNLDYNKFLGSLDEIWSYVQGELVKSSAFDTIGVYYSLALLALGSKDETQQEILDALNDSSEDNIFSAAALLNKTIPTYSQYNFESYIDLTEVSHLDQEFDHKITKYIPLIVKRKSRILCKDLGQCSSMYYTLNTILQKQQVCFTSYSDYKADWADQFNPQQTSQMTYNDDDGSVQQVPIMSRTGIALYKEDKDEYNMQMLTIPFASSDSVLLLMKANDGTTIFNFVKKVQANFDKLIKNMMYQQEPTNVKIGLPKFKKATHIDFVLEYVLEGKIDKIFTEDAETAILKKYPNAHISRYITDMEFYINEEGINYKAKTVVGNLKCDNNPERKTPTLKKSSAKSPFAVPEIVNLVAGIADKTLKPASETVKEFTGTSPFLYFVVTTDLTVLTAGLYKGIKDD